MRVPHHKYLLYLILTKHTDQEIRNLLQHATGRDTSVAYLNKVRQENLFSCSDPVLMVYYNREDPQLLVKLHRPDVPIEWIEKLGLLDAHSSSDQFRRAYEIFSDHRKCHYINLYLLCLDSSPEKILEIYKKRFNETLTYEDLVVYVSYFADFESMTAIDWERYLPKLEPQLRTMYEAAPGRKIPYIQWRMGDKVDIDPETVNHTLMADFFHLSRDEYDTAAKRDGWAERATKFAGLALSAGDRVRAHSKPAKTTRSLLMLFEEKAEQIANYAEVHSGDAPDEPDDSVTDIESDSDDNEEAI